MITDISLIDFSKKYNYADYLTWKFEQMVELIRGRVWSMSPSPGTTHQRISMNLTKQLLKYFDNNKCQLFAAPYDVRLLDKKKSVKSNKDIYTVVQPDLCIICDDSKIDELGCKGAPDLIVEILSPGNSKKEMRIKYELYEEFGVNEYWIVDPERQTLYLFYLEHEKKYQLDKIYIKGDILTSKIFPELQLDLEKIFPDK